MTDSVPARALVQRRKDVDLAALALAQFESGVLRPRDVKTALCAGDALAEGITAWIRRHRPRCQRLNFGFELLDHGVVSTELQQFGWEDNLDAPVYLGIVMPQESVFVIGDKADVLRATSPGLLCTAMALVRDASSRTVHVRTPDDYLEMFGRWHWEYETSATDEDVREGLAERFGEGDSDIERYLPSVVRSEMAPDEFLPKYMRVDRRSSDIYRELSGKSLMAVAARQRGWVRSLCLELAALKKVLARSKARRLFGDAQWGEPAYAAASIVTIPGGYAEEVIDDHFECLSNAGDCTMYQMFVPLATTPESIRAQYADWAIAFEVIARLDRVLTLLSSPDPNQ
ncbi:PRTRC system protein F [Cupriavidus sp. D39]|uniref:PRTRC system protein F n=1 Tax=Cupriavidus sp. D39 TaxID=2997877 RepID=UPI002271A451|nr:PRTRC system protein F [Cupriavidus sp. D39]MCY0852457.1 PRTRC system protein F [Cupriavidus sp. D39]